MRFVNCAALAAVLFTTLIPIFVINLKFETLFFCRGWDCS